MGRHKIYENVEELEKDIDEYFEKCNIENRPYTLSGLAYALNLDRKTLYNYSKNDDFFPTIKRAKEKVEQQLEENALLGKGNSTFTIFNLKNNFGWKDTIIQENKDITKVDELLKEIKENAIK